MKRQEKVTNDDFKEQKRRIRNLIPLNKAGVSENRQCNAFWFILYVLVSEVHTALMEIHQIFIRYCVSAFEIIIIFYDKYHDP